ncbi:SPOR domain-containing protein [Aureimonas sp. N4]|uniref:SPOR domain-containing protein n=1 Tax=Aureimonas sp. N4 TaxID=1638165 RepID=UPI00078265AE|nr:SPOR domain-containing protein [Aureimonas sp. N4]
MREVGAMKDYRDAHFSATDRDPFADLVRAVEGSSGRGSSQAARQDWAGSHGYEPVLGPEDRVAAPMPQGRPSRPVNAETQEALRNLSQPARPRDRYPTETQSFAPAREIEPEPYVAPRQQLSDTRQTLTLDDFDDLIASEWAAMQPAPQAYDEDEYGYDDDRYGEEAAANVRRPSRLRKFAMVMGGMAATVVVAVAGTMVYTGGGSLAPGNDGPILIKADAQPYKVVPAETGGRTIPNQNKAVYEHVAAGNAKVDAPTQRKLVTAMEEPIDISENDDASSAALPGVMVGENVALPSESDAEPEVPPAPGAQVASAEGTLQPRKVRTLTVRPDGSLAPAAEEASIAGQPAMLPTSSTPIAHKPAAAAPVAAVVAPTMPAAAPQPDPVQVASVQPAQPSDDAFFVQISSQPSQALAEESMANLSKRFSSVIGGRNVGIKSAEIAGKGTFYRVRVAAKTKGEAASLCDSLKSAGGSCFVTR